MINIIGNIIGAGRSRISYAKKISNEYRDRVLADGGTVESLACFTSFASSWDAYQPPICIAATDLQSTSFVANWKPYKNAIYYLLDVSTTDGFTSFVTKVKVDAPSTSYLVTGLTPNTTYYYRVRASLDNYVFAYVNWEDNYENWNEITTTWNY